ncbi:MAG: hypothetical protein RBS38_02575 [Bacteroidales bacterium]|jgi:hypothetical protein|nr:hypothetical protein [Bacteroidales bacterium]
MLIRRSFTLIFAIISISYFASAQQDSIKTDSTKLYQDIESYSKRSKLNEFFYRLIFKPVTPGSKDHGVRRKTYKKLIQKPYSTFEGKIIRNIDVITLDPFGYSATDTTASKPNFLYTAGNSMHIKTQGITIRNLLLVHRNQPFNSLLVKESERLIRSQKYVHEVSFSVVPSGVNLDSVDIYIRELDNWSIIPEGSISASKMKVSLTDKNFLGTGHEFQNDFSRSFKREISFFNTDYFIPSFRNSYISAKLHLGFDGYGNFSRNIEVDRPFFSPLAKWAAGVSFAAQTRKDSLMDINYVYVPVNLKFRTQDYWAGKALQLFKGSTEDVLVTNLILAARYLHIRYLEKPPELLDPFHNYSNENFFLGTVGISTRRYVQDKYIFKYGVVEDVPVGSVYSLTAGYQVKNNSGRFYSGMRVYFGDYYEWGFLSSNLEYGAFIKSSHIEQGVLTAGVNYFTGLFEIGQWKFRQFIKPQMTIGVNRFSSDSLTLNDSYGLEGFYSPVLSGTNRFLLTLQTQSYAPWNILGFRLGPYLAYSLGMLSDAETGFRDSKVYSQIGLGVLIKNENLVFSTFQISVSFYPLIPGKGQNIFKMNSFRTTDFGFRDFEIGKPGGMIYQ